MFFFFWCYNLLSLCYTDFALCFVGYTEFFGSLHIGLCGEFCVWFTYNIYYYSCVWLDLVLVILVCLCFFKVVFCFYLVLRA